MNNTIFQGLDVAWKGLVGVFAILVLFFFLIKLMLYAFKEKKS